MDGKSSVLANVRDLLIKHWSPGVVVHIDAVTVGEFSELLVLSNLWHLAHINLQSLADPSLLLVWRGIGWRHSEICKTLRGILADEGFDLVVSNVLPHISVVGLHVAVDATN